MFERLSALFLGPWRRESVLGYALAVAALCAALLIVGFRITAQTNHKMEPFDQGAYVRMAQHLEGSWYPWYTDGTRNPLLPWLAATFLDTRDVGFFEKGKRLNVLVAVAGTALLAVFFASRMGPLAAFNATALAGLAVLLPIGTFFGAEALFFVLFLFLCVCGMRLLNENPLWLYAAAGLLAALAWLAKSSSTPFVGLFLLFSFVRLLLNTFWREKLPWHLRAPQWGAGRFATGLALFALIFAALIAPRLVHAQRTWGSAFYSLPSFWFWADDWDTCVQKYADCRKVRLAQLPPEEQPTLAGYFRRHSLNDAIQRITEGASVRLKQFFHPEGKWQFPYDKAGKLKRVVLPHRGFYLIGLSLLAAAMAALAARSGRLTSVGPVTLPILLGLAMFALYTLAMGWYLPTGPGHRFIMTLVLPILWMLTQGGNQLRAATGSLPANGLFLTAHGGIALLLISRLAILLADGNFEKISYAF